jgi:hypothetical protein
VVLATLATERSTHGCPSKQEPPNDIHLEFEEALEQLAALEEARDALLTTDHLVEVAVVFTRVQRLSHQLGFQSPEGGGPDAN